MSAPGYDEGGVLPAGEVRIDPSTLMARVWWTDEQAATFLKAAAMVAKWEARDSAKSETTHG